MTNLELLEEIRKDLIVIKNNDPIINSAILIFITKFKERMYKLDLPVVVKSVKEKEIPTFQEWLDENDITLYCGRYYANTSVEGWTWREIDKIYKKETHQL